MFATANYSIGQESINPLLEGMESEKNKSTEYNTFHDGESPSNSQRLPYTSTTTPRDTARTRSNIVRPKTTQTKPEETPAKAEDSVLGFNFLYYIFQKYKMSDIID